MISTRSDSEMRSSPPSDPLVALLLLPLFPPFVLASRVFLWRWPLIADMDSLYESLASDSLIDRDQGLLDEMRKRNEEEIKKLDEK